jgi:hypothetical protein
LRTEQRRNVCVGTESAGATTQKWSAYDMKSTANWLAGKKKIMFQGCATVSFCLCMACAIGRRATRMVGTYGQGNSPPLMIFLNLFIYGI